MVTTFVHDNTRVFGHVGCQHYPRCISSAREKAVNGPFDQLCTNLNVIVANNETVTSTEKGTLTILTKTGDIVLTGYFFNEKASPTPKHEP
jgi:hypothetical protein